MLRARVLSSILVLMLASACTPIVYERAGYNYSEPARPLYVQNSYLHQSQYRPYTGIRPIEINLFSDTDYRGRHFQPVRLVIYDGQYIELPMNNRRGQLTKIYAHYLHESLHFDRDRQCSNLHGSSVFSYDKSWEKGRHYSHINAGSDFDLRGLRLEVRSAAANGQSKSHNDRHIGDRNKEKQKGSSSRLTSDNSQSSELHHNLASQGRTRLDHHVNSAVGSSSHRYADNRINRQSRAADDSSTNKSPAKSSSIQVSIDGGAVTINNKRDKFGKVSVKLNEGEARTLILRLKSGTVVNVPISYHNGTLKLASTGQQFTKDKSWNNGKSFKVDANSDSRLKNLKLSVVAL